MDGTANKTDINLISDRLYNFLKCTLPNLEVNFKETRAAVNNSYFTPLS